MAVVDLSVLDRRGFATLLARLLGEPRPDHFAVGLLRLLVDDPALAVGASWDLLVDLAHQRYVSERAWVDAPEGHRRPYQLRGGLDPASAARLPADGVLRAGRFRQPHTGLDGAPAGAAAVATPAGEVVGVAILEHVDTRHAHGYLSFAMVAGAEPEAVPFLLVAHLRRCFREHPLRHVYLELEPAAVDALGSAMPALIEPLGVLRAHEWVDGHHVDLAVARVERARLDGWCRDAVTTCGVLGARPADLGIEP